MEDITRSRHRKSLLTHTLKHGKYDQRVQRKREKEQRTSPRRKSSPERGRRSDGLKEHGQPNKATRPQTMGGGRGSRRRGGRGGSSGQGRSGPQEKAVLLPGVSDGKRKHETRATFHKILQRAEQQQQE